jgi:aminoglycoside/choline kinase family phosphotransferase
MRMPPERERERRDFVDRSGWRGAQIVPLPGDASTRSYARVSLNGRKAMLMDQPQNAETPAAPADATPEERRALGYNAVARLAGGDVARFVAVADYLRDRGLSAPEIFTADPAAGFALIEDLGDDLYADVLAKDGDERALYAAAARVLAQLHARGAPDMLAPGKPLHAYDETAQLAEIDLLTEWFFPYAMKRKASDDEVAEHRALWRAALAKTRGTPPVFVHRDYHAQNLLWLPDRAGVARVGLIDFQDAVAGSPAQDLMHLIEDARRDVSRETSAAAVQHYLDAMRRAGRPVDAEAFRAEMATISGQRNARIVGIFSRLFKRDGKPRYLSYLPRVWGHLNRDLEHPALASLKSWYDGTIPREARGHVEGALS